MLARETRADSGSAGRDGPTAGQEPESLAALEALLRQFRRRELRQRVPAPPSTARLDLAARLAALAAGYALIFAPSVGLRLAGSGLFAVACVSLVGSWFHESIHGNLRWPGAGARALRRLASAPLGLSPMWWVYKHVRLHHPYLGDPDRDPDIQFGAVGRVSPDQPWRRTHRTQHLHMWMLMPLATLNMLKPGERAMARSTLSPAQYAAFPAVRIWIDKYVPCAAVWAPVPVAVGARAFLASFVVFHLVAGTLASVVTQAQHNTDRSLPTGGGWDGHPLSYQLLSSSDVGRRRGLWWWISGGTTFHVAHHLLPSLPFLELPPATARLRVLLQGSGLAVAVPEHRNMRGAMAAHFRLARDLSRRPSAASHHHSPGGLAAPTVLAPRRPR